MLNISLDAHKDLYFDYQKCQEFLASIKDVDYEYPDNVTLFHIYTEVKNDKELECIKSFLATQNLDKTRLIVWSDYDISNNERIKPYKDFIELRIWNAKEEAKGTLLEGVNHLNTIDDNYWAQSDLLRILVLYKYGGVWADMDIVFLRDFKPILDQEYMYQWGSETNFERDGACGTVLAGFKKSEFMLRLLHELKKSPIQEKSTVWGKDLFAKVWAKWPNFTIFPSPFFNTEWLISKTDVKLSEDIPNGWFKDNEIGKKYLFLESFAWHWHNSSNKKKNVEVGSKFHELRKITNRKLEEKGIISNKRSPWHLYSVAKSHNYLATKDFQDVSCHLNFDSWIKKTFDHLISVCDIGGGNGRVMILIKDKVSHYTCLDINEYCLEKGKDFFNDELAEFIYCDLNNKHFSLNDTYDVGYIDSVLTMVENPFELLKTLVKKCDYVFVNRTSLNERKSEKTSHYWSGMPSSATLWKFSKDDLEGFCLENNFEIIKIDNISFIIKKG